MNNASQSIVSLQPDDPIVPDASGIITAAGQSANQIAANYVFGDYRQRRAPRTIRTQTAALVLWVEYLAQIGAGSDILSQAGQWALRRFSHTELVAFSDYADGQSYPLDIVYSGHYCQQNPAAWHGITWGLVEGFVKWMLGQGYTIASVNNRLSAVKVYARLAAKAGVIPPSEHALIREVRGYGLSEGKRVDERRPYARIGHKKENAIVLTSEQANLLKNSYSPTPQGIRDHLMICLLLDLGLRASEVAALKVEDLSDSGYVIVYRQKTDSTDKMELSADLLRALAAFQPYQRQNGVLLRGSRKNGKLTNNIMSVRAISRRIQVLGRDFLGIWDLSPHDLRHTWATIAAKNSNPFALRDAGGWSNMQTPSRYVERAKVVNKGIKLEY